VSAAARDLAEAGEAELAHQAEEHAQQLETFVGSIDARRRELPR
jgi:hypothetical protein